MEMGRAQYRHYISAPPMLITASSATSFTWPRISKAAQTPIHEKNPTKKRSASCAPTLPVGEAPEHKTTLNTCPNYQSIYIYIYISIFAEEIDWKTGTTSPPRPSHHKSKKKPEASTFFHGLHHACQTSAICCVSVVGTYSPCHGEYVPTTKTQRKTYRQQSNVGKKPAAEPNCGVTTCLRFHVGCHPRHDHVWLGRNFHRFGTMLLFFRSKPWERHIWRNKVPPHPKYRATAFSRPRRPLGFHHRLSSHHGFFRSFTMRIFWGPTGETWKVRQPNIGVSKKKRIPKWMVYNGKPYLNSNGFGGPTPIFRLTPICLGWFAQATAQDCRAWSIFPRFTWLPMVWVEHFSKMGKNVLQLLFLRIG